MTNTLPHDLDFDPASIKGLTENEAALRLKQDGPNELPAAKYGGMLKIFLEMFRDPIFILLAVSSLLYFILGDKQEALMLAGFVLFIMAITLYQEHKTDRAVEALRDMTSPRALVIRDGEQRRIPGREVVRGDAIILSEGDRVPADSAILWSTHLRTDESLLTGESVPVSKSIWDNRQEIGRPGGEDLPFVFSGTLVVQGKAVAQVMDIGARTQIGLIGKALESVAHEETPLQGEMRKLVKTLAIIGLSLCALVVVAYGLTWGNWLNGFLAGITLAMAILPNEFPVVLSIFLALGAWRISKKHVLTRRVPAVETLGSATVLCVDKTGTLTQNKMTPKKLFVEGDFLNLELKSQDLPEKFHPLVEFGILASQPEPFDPMEKALKKLGEDLLSNTEHLHEDWRLVKEYPLTRELLALSHVWQSPDGKNWMIGAKGAPEAIADLCHYSPEQTQELLSNVKKMASEGLRVIAVAQSHFTQNVLPDIQHDFTFNFLGLVGFADPIRPQVPAAVKECYSAGIRVIMITGDYPETARAIARDIGLANPQDCINGEELSKMTDEQLRDRIRSVNLFARVVPEQKLRLVNALKGIGEIVAMTGDGVNDAPALKSAHIGIAMGERGTDVAREAASLVLTDDNFSSIVESVRLGRRIFDNLKKAIAYLLAVHIPIAGISLFPVLFKWPLVLLPVHIAFLHLIIDPACSVVFEAEPEEKGIMSRKPRDASKPLFDRKLLGWSSMQGIGILIILLSMFGIALYRGQGETEARALTFTTLVIANLALILTNRSWEDTILGTLHSANPALWWVMGGGLSLLGLILFNPMLQKLFHFSQLHFDDMILCFTAGGLSVIWFEFLKYFKKRQNKNQTIS